jgi:hypothetical protein
MFSFLLCGTVDVGLLLYKTLSDIFCLLFLVKVLQMNTVQHTKFLACTSNLSVSRSMMSDCYVTTSHSSASNIM